MWLALLLPVLALLLPVTAHATGAAVSGAVQDEGDGQEPVVEARPGRSAVAEAPAPEARVEVWRALRQDKARSMEPVGDGDSFPARLAAPVEGLLDAADDLNLKPVLYGGHQDNSPAIGFRYENVALGHDRAWLEMPNRADLMLEATTSVDGHNHATGEISIHRLLDLPVRAVLLADYARHPHDTFYGLGGDSLRANRSNYRLTVFEAGTRLEWTLARQVRLHTAVGLLNVDTGPGGGAGNPSVDVLFDDLGLPAFEDRADFAVGRAGLEVDWRDDKELPRGGGLVALEVETFEELSVSRFDFRRYRAEVQQYFPFFNEQRIIALRALTVFTEALDEGLVPFYFMPTLGHGDALRGFDSFRFRDRHALLLQGEYRWVAWQGVEMALFLDAGKVFADLDELDLRGLETGYGVGFRFHGPESVMLRVDIARSRERIRPHFSFSHVF